MDNVQCYQPFADQLVSSCLHCRNLRIECSCSLPVTRQHEAPVAPPVIRERVRRSDASSISTAPVAAALSQSAAPAVALLPAPSSSSSSSISTIPLPPSRPNYAYVLVPPRPLFTPRPPPTTRSSLPIVQTTIVPPRQHDPAPTPSTHTLTIAEIHERIAISMIMVRLTRLERVLYRVLELYDVPMADNVHERAEAIVEIHQSLLQALLDALNALEGDGALFTSGQ